MPGTRTATYSMWLQPETVEETSSSDSTGTGAGDGTVTRTTTTRFDTAGRTTGTHTTLGTGTGPGGTVGALPGNVAVNGSTTTYSSATGLVTTTTETTGGNAYTSTGRQTTRTYDTWGRELTYTPDSVLPDGASTSLTTRTTYDDAGRIASVTVPVGPSTTGATRTDHVTTYTYDGTDSQGNEERRGLVTAVQVTGLATQTGAYDAAGQLVRELLPGRIVRTRGYDVAGEPTEVTYSGPMKYRTAEGQILDSEDPVPWFGFSQANDVEGRVRAEWTPAGVGFDTDALEAAELPVLGQALGYARTFDYDRAERLVRVHEWTRASLGEGTVDSRPITSDGTTAAPEETLPCNVRVYTFDVRGRREQLRQFNGALDGTGAGECPATTTTGPGTGVQAAWTRSASYDGADRPLTGSVTTTPTEPGVTGVLTGTGAYTYDALGRQLTIPAVDTPAFRAGDATAGPIDITYDTNDAARTISQAITVETGRSVEPDTGEMQTSTARVLERTQLGMDGTGRRQVETRTATPLDGNGQPAGSPVPVTTLTRYYGDDSDNPAWTLTQTHERTNSSGGLDAATVATERAFSAEGIGGYWSVPAFLDTGLGCQLADFSDVSVS